MVSQMISSDQLKALAKTELMQAFGSVFILIAILGSITVMDTILAISANNIDSPCVALPEDHPILYANPDSTYQVLSDMSRTNQYAYCYLNNLYDIFKQACMECII
jgi:hypothetical protein